MEARRVELLSISPAPCRSTRLVDSFKFREAVAPVSRANTATLTYYLLLHPQVADATVAQLI